MKDKVVGGMQNFSKAMIGPVLFLPVVGMLIALTAIATNTAIVTDGGFIWTAGKFFNGMLNPIMGNLSILFCVGIAMGMSKKKKADAAFVALMCYILFLGANSRWLELSGKLIEGATAGDLYGTGQTIQLGFHVTDMGVFLGMIIGVLTAWVHNRHCDTEFKGGFAPYGNSKLVFILMIPVTAVLSIGVTYLWPTVANGISALTGFMSTAGALGVFVYGFLNRFLIPTGLHHLIWSPFLYSAVGGQSIINNENVIGAKPIFLALLSDQSGAMMPDTCRFLTYGLVKTFGVIGVALAFYVTAKKSEKSQLKGTAYPVHPDRCHCRYHGTAGIHLHFRCSRAVACVFHPGRILPDGHLHSGRPCLRHQRHPGFPGAEPSGRRGPDHVAHVYCHRPCGNRGHVRGI